MSDILNVPYWEDTTIESIVTKNYYLPDKVETVIIGAGIQGLLMGYVLAKQGHKCHIFDGAAPGARSSLKGEGIIGLGPCAFPSKLLDSFDGSSILKLVTLSLENLQVFKNIIANHGDQWCEFAPYGSFHIPNKEYEKYIDSTLDIYKTLDL